MRTGEAAPLPKVWPDDASRRQRTPDGRWLAVPFGKSIRLVDLEFPNTPREKVRREHKARIDPWRHDELARAAEDRAASLEQQLLRRDAPGKDAGDIPLDLLRVPALKPAPEPRLPDPRLPDADAALFDPQPKAQASFATPAPDTPAARHSSSSPLSPGLGLHSLVTFPIGGEGRGEGQGTVRHHRERPLSLILSPRFEPWQDSHVDREGGFPVPSSLRDSATSRLRVSALSETPSETTSDTQPGSDLENACAFGCGSNDEEAPEAERDDSDCQTLPPQFRAYDADAPARPVSFLPAGEVPAEARRELLDLWYVAMFHRAWMLIVRPEDGDAHDRLHAAHQRWQALRAADLKARHKTPSPGERFILPPVIRQTLKLPRGTALRPPQS